MSLDPLANEHLDMNLLRNKLLESDPLAMERLLTLPRQYRPRIVFNMGTHPAEIKLAGPISKSLERVLMLKADYLGFIFQDPTVPASVKSHVAYLPAYAQSVAADDIRRLADRIIRFWHQPLEESEARLFKQTQKVFKERMKG